MWGSKWVSILFNIINYWVMRHRVYNFSDDTHLRGVAEEPEGCVATQRDPGRSEKWADRSIRMLNKRKCKPLLSQISGKNNPG